MEDKDNLQKNTQPKASDILHDHSKLSSLRTYQGDMAEFIHEKDESIASISLKEKIRREEIQKQNRTEVPKKSNLHAVLAIAVSLILLVVGAGATFYISKSINQGSVAKVQLNDSLIPYSEPIKISNLSKETLGGIFQQDNFGDGVSLFVLEGVEATLKVNDFLQQNNIDLPNALERNLGDRMAIGVFKNSTGKITPFIILTVREFGPTFAGMLEWETSISKDLDFMVSSQATSTPNEWRDVILKNKDTRALLTPEGESIIAYTFINKQTVLLIKDMEMVPDINSIYISSSVSR